LACAVPYMHNAGWNVNFLPHSQNLQGLSSDYNSGHAANYNACSIVYAFKRKVYKKESVR